MVTDVGRRRDHNEDSYLCNQALGLFAVADGMGGHLGGERASRVAVDVVEKELTLRSPALRTASGPTSAADAAAVVTPGGTVISAHPVAVALGDATRKAAQQIFSEAAREPDLTGMGTTLTAIMFHGDQVSVSHVGDSRLYLFRDGRIRQLTEDHSWIQEQIRAGRLSPEDAMVTRFRNIITRSVGFEPEVQPDLQTLAVEPGDCLVLCSDGLSNYVETDELGRVLTAHFYRDAGQALVDIANQRGGDDNITVLVAYVGNG